MHANRLTAFSNLKFYKTVRNQAQQTDPVEKENANAVKIIRVFVKQRERSNNHIKMRLSMLVEHNLQLK